MLLTLMRHGLAERYSQSDAGRPLTDPGRAIVRDVVRGLHNGGWLPGAVVCSPLLRSRQTAELVIEQYPGLPLEVLGEVVQAEPILLEELGWRDLIDPLIIGHEPGLSRMAARLIGAEGLMAFEEASVACFRIDDLPPRKPAELIFFAPPSFALAART
ncbi:MAG: histidine phosphatase family protein [Myxococcota bacterium]|nr:histidine phosphatase family protein [Myxococcota bacterium]